MALRLNLPPVEQLGWIVISSLYNAVVLNDLVWAIKMKTNTHPVLNSAGSHSNGVSRFCGGRWEGGRFIGLEGRC